jgi:molybdopterin molybdotransferase
LHAALQRLGCEIIDLGIVADNQSSLRQCLTQAAQQADVIFSSGGVSVGEADFTRDVLTDLGQIGFWKIAMKPGRPVAFGRIDQSLFFGLPGNPVAVMVTFFQFAKPTLEKIMGITQPLLAPTFEVPSVSKMRKRPGRTEYQRGILHQTESGEWAVKITGKQGSGILQSMALANCFIILPHDSASVESGTPVLVQPFAGLF